MANRKAEFLTGYAHDELTDSDLFSLLFDERGRDVSEAWSAVTEDHPVETDLETRTRTGKMRAVRWHVTTRQRSEAQALGFVAAGIDSTHERELSGKRGKTNDWRQPAAGPLVLPTRSATP